MVRSESIREKTESNLASNISIHLVTNIVTCQRMILRGERIFSGWADAFLRLFKALLALQSYQRLEKHELKPDET